MKYSRHLLKKLLSRQLNTDAADIDAFKAEKWALDTSMTVDEKLAAMIAKIGENMNIRRFRENRYLRMESLYLTSTQQERSVF